MVFYNSSYPTALKTVLKVGPVLVVMSGLGILLPVCLYDILYHSHERIDKFYWRSSRYERLLRSRDMKLRMYWDEAINWQPTNRDAFVPYQPRVAT